MANRITHIRKPDVNSTVEHITHVKGLDSKGSEFVSTVPQVITQLKTGIAYYVRAGGETISVTHQKSSAGNEYIKTKPDSTKKDNLLSLPQF